VISLSGEQREALAATLLREYSFKRLPCERDVHLRAIVRQVEDAEDYAVLRDVAPAGSDAALAIFAERVASLAVRAPQAWSIRDGLVACQLAAATGELQRAFPPMSMLYRACQRLGADPRAEFTAVAELTSGDVLRQFLAGARPARDRPWMRVTRPGRRWLARAATGLALLVGVTFLVGAEGPGGGTGLPTGPRARFLLTADRTDPSTGGAVWFQVYRLEADGMPRLIQSVQHSSPPAGEVQALLAAPGGGYLVASSRAELCRSVIHRFRLGATGQVTGFSMIGGDTEEGIIGGMAVSPDGARIAYATLPCGSSAEGSRRPLRAVPSTDPAQQPVLTVLETATGRRRQWTTPPGSILGSIVWARDSRTVGYTLGRITGGGIDGVTLYALNTAAPGTHLPAGRVLLDPAAYQGNLSMVWMDLDGRGGGGTLHRPAPPATVIFSFTEGRPIHVIHTYEQSGFHAMVAIAFSDVPRYACLGGIDAFGRTYTERSGLGSRGVPHCATATDLPR
jgi:hypothetical protein